MDLKLMRDQAERRATRKSLVRTADRGEKIRTYNYPQVGLCAICRVRHVEYFLLYKNRTESPIIGWGRGTWYPVRPSWKAADYGH